MVVYESFILIFTFLLLNIPVFISLYKFVFKELNIYAKLAICVFYWVSAFITHELAPFIGVLILLSRVHGKEDNDIEIRDINIWKIKFKDAVNIAGAALVFKLVISQLNRIYVDILSIYFGLQVEPQEIVKEFAVEELYYKMLLFALVVILAPFVEEYIFRYYIYDKLLLPRMPSLAAAVISSALFTLLHLNISGIPTFFGLGLYCTLMYEKKGFYGAVITHVVSNLATAVLLM
ncbi:MAG TPA: CPBP family intramembrane glutamic endopeptidase [Clostridia bacterium]|nr:CPBP family intramembrane glutamic endopeptidase [Clostridia bacterium]